MTKKLQIISEGERKDGKAQEKTRGTEEVSRGWKNVDHVDGQSVGGEQRGTICRDERFLWQLTT